MGEVPETKIRSDSCGLEQLIASYDEGRIRDRLALGNGWPRRWSGTWLVGEGEVSWPVRDMGSVPVFSSKPVLQFPIEKIPSRTTLWRVWHEWFGPGGGRQRYERSADEAEEAGVARRVVVHRPGQVLALDSTPMPVKLRETVFGDAVTATLTLALDLYSHSLPAFRLTLQSDTSVDVAMLLRDVMLPLPMREGWGEEMQWPYPGVPADVIAEFTGCGVAALPFFAPETVTTDHGSPWPGWNT